MIIETPEYKFIRSESYNVDFNKKTGQMFRWGKTHKDDPFMSPFGPELLDLEISVNGCNGAGNGPCKFCYKSNTNKPAKNMSMKTFMKILNKFPRHNSSFYLQQIAFGITGVQTNFDFISMMKYARAVGIIPNFTLSGFDLTDDIAEECAKVVGALAVSCYESDKNLCYNTINKFTDLSVKQTNMHLLYHDSNLNFIKEVFNDIVTDKRLSKLNAVVLLGLKRKGRGAKLEPATEEHFNEIVALAMKLKLPLGFDSCSASKFDKWLDNTAYEGNKDAIRESIEPCESFGLFSSYINVDGDYFPCSFAEETPGWETGINVLEYDDFMKDVWFSDRLEQWRQKSLAANRECIIYPEIN